MRSGDLKRYATAITLLMLGGAVGGCVETTQEKNARAQLQDDRLLASRSSVHVTQLDPHVAVLKVRMLRSREATAIVVTVRNEGTKPVSDLPLNVGVTKRGGTSYLNRAPELPYFQTHIAGIGAKAQATWVFTSSHATPAGPPLARVGPSAIAIGGGVQHLPAIASSVTSVRSRGHDRALLGAQITNRSDVGQNGLEVYAYALSGERLVAAGAASIASLGPGAKRAVQIPLVGDPGAGTVHLETPPTNLR